MAGWARRASSISSLQRNMKWNRIHQRKVVIFDNHPPLCNQQRRMGPNISLFNYILIEPPSSTRFVSCSFSLKYRLHPRVGGWNSHLPLMHASIPKAPKGSIDPCEAQKEKGAETPIRGQWLDYLDVYFHI